MFHHCCSWSWFLNMILQFPWSLKKMSWFISRIGSQFFPRNSGMVSASNSPAKPFQVESSIGSRSMDSQTSRWLAEKSPQKMGGCFQDHRQPKENHRKRWEIPFLIGDWKLAKLTKNGGFSRSSLIGGIGDPIGTPRNFARNEAQMPKTKHELNVTTYQMCILMLFNQHVTLTYKERFDAVWCGLMRFAKIAPENLQVISYSLLWKPFPI